MASAVASSSKLSGNSKSVSTSNTLTATQHEPDVADDSESSEEEEGDDESSLDSEGDLEAVTPKRKAGETPSKTPAGKSLPKYVPPHGMIRANIDATFKDSPFEYDRLASDPSLQLWAIRVPIDFKASRLSSLSFKAPTTSRKPSGTLKTKSTTYKLSAAGEPTTSKAVVDEEGRQPTAGPGAADSMGMNGHSLRAEGGEEMGGGMRLLVPRVKQNSALLVAPIPVSQHLLLEPQIEDTVEIPENSALPSYLSEGVPDATSAGEVHMEGVLPGKRAQPSHLFKFRNRAFGFDTPGPAATVVADMDVDGETSPAEAATAADEAEPELPKEKKKKRKSEGKDALSSPKKSKKSKV